MQRNKNAMEEAKPEDAFDDLLIPATRYYLGRKTISVTSHAKTLAQQWHHLDAATRRTLRRDIEREFERDDWARERGEDLLPLGEDCDRETWEAVREAWRQMEP